MGDEHTDERGAVVRYGIALLCVGGAIVARLLMTPVFHERLPLFTFFPAVVIAAAAGGIGPALVTSIVGYLAAYYLFIAPNHQLTAIRDTPEAPVVAFFFVLVGLITGWLHESAHRARRRADASRRVAEERAGALDREMAQRRVTEDRLRLALSHAPVIIYGCDRELRYTWIANLPRSYRSELLIGKRDDDLLGIERVGRLMEFKRRVLETGKGDRYHATWLIDGKPRRFHVIAEPVRDAAGTVTGLTVAALDVTERARLGELEATLAAVAESSDDAILGKDLDGKIIAWSAGAERIFGYTAAEAVGRSIIMLLPADRLSEETDILATLRRGERVDHYETRRVRKDGEVIDVSISVSPIRDADGTVIGGAHVARDVSARKHAEREREELLRRAEEARAAAESASQAKDTFLATVSHELRTPLSPILAWATLLRQRRVKEDRTQHAFETIERCARTQSQLIDDLLDISRIVTGKLRLTVAPVSLADVVTAAVEVVRPAADARGIRMNAVLDSEATISGDRERLQQVVWNLLSNAIKFTPRGGRVQVVVERVNSHIEVAVTDSGEGIEPEFLPHIFGRFVQADSTPSRVHGGLGLGLAIARHIVELHGGSIHVESPGRGLGSVFTVKLPRMATRTAGEADRRHPTEPPALAADGMPRLDGVRILLVDDEPDSNEVVTAILASAGAEVRAVATVDAALDALRTWIPDVLVSDVGMPDKDGYALIRGVRAMDGRVRGMPAIALTAYATVEDRVRLLSAGFQMHVPKPVDAAELVSVVANVARMVVKR